MTKLTIKTAPTPDGFRVALVGDIDAFQVDLLDAEINRLIQASPKLVAIDFKGVTFISSAGMGAFVRLWSALTKLGGVLLLGGAAPQIVESFHRARLDRMLKFVESV